MPKRLEIFIESVILASRWLLVIFYLGLAIALAVYAITFGVKLWDFTSKVFSLGEADAILADRDFLAPIVEESGGELVWVEGMDQVALGEGIGMGLRQSDTELLATFDAQIAAMKEDGSLNALIKKHFGDDAQTYE